LPNAHDLHDFDVQTGYLLELRVIGEIDSRALQASVEFSAAISKWDVISIQHYGVEYPAILLSLYVTNHSCHIELIELPIFL
jgi:hypothetical protein